MTTHVDLGPAARRMARLVEAVPDDALDHPTGGVGRRRSIEGLLHRRGTKGQGEAADVVDRILGIAGRDPNWRPPEEDR